MKKEPRWICTRNPKHFQKIKPGDLKLKKMAGLIPTEEDLLRVKTYLNIENAEEMQNADSPSDDTPFLCRLVCFNNNIEEVHSHAAIL